MSITKEKGSNKRSGLCKLKFDGELSIYSAEQTKKELGQYMDDYKVFALNLSTVEELDTAGVQLLSVFKRELENNNKQVYISEIGDVASRILQVYQMQDKFSTGDSA